MSHSSRVRGLKYYNTDNIHKHVAVALLASAWIEINVLDEGGNENGSRTPRECVD